jgi:hypothetical protein
MIKIKPPTHKIDGAAVFVSSTDSAWDLDRIKAEREAWCARALDEKRSAFSYPADPEQAALVRDSMALSSDEIKAAIARSCVERYFAGRTRYQLGADDWGADGKPATARGFLMGKPAEFGLRRLDYRAYSEVAETQQTRARLIEACRLGLRSITADGYSWTVKGDEVAGDEQLNALHEANPNLLPEIGAAVLALSRPLDPEAEGPR